MAKIKNLYVKGYKGRLGGVTYFTRAGEQMNRELPAQVANPNTSAQATQRTRWANMVHFYRVNKFWMYKNAFENKKATQSDYNKFVSMNSAAVPVYLTKAQSAAGAVIVAPYQVTDGTLPSISCEVADGALKTDIYLTAEVGRDLDGTFTVSALSTSILASNNGLKEGDQLSFISVYNTTINNVPSIVARAYELILDTTDISTLESNGLDFLSGNESNGVYFLVATPAHGTSWGATVVMSRTESGKTHVSTQVLCLSPDAQVNYANFSNDTAKTAARRSYGAQSEYFLDTQYSGNASNSSVPISLAILNVGGKVAGSYAGNVVSNEVHDLLPVTFNRSVESNEITGAAVRVNFGENPDYVSVEIDSVAGSAAYLNTNSLGSGNYQVMTGVRITTTSGNLFIEFSASDGGDNGEGITG